MTRRRISILLEPLLALLACLALLGGPLPGFLSPSRLTVVTEEEHERSGQERSETGTHSPLTTISSAGHRLERRELRDRVIYEFRPASRHVPGLASARPPRPSPCWVRPLRC